MSNQITTGYQLPFEVDFADGQTFSDGSSMQGMARIGVISEAKRQQMTDSLELFSRLACTGAMSGRLLPPGQSLMHLDKPILFAKSHCYFVFRDCAVDPRSIVILSHLLLARQDTIKTEILQLFRAGAQPIEQLKQDPDISTYPKMWASLPFDFSNEEPESGGYTFTAALQNPLKSGSACALESALHVWTEAVRAGAYGLAPIPPEESYAEPDRETVTSFDSTVEWTIFKVRADPACIDGIINIFCAFHDRYQQITSLTIS